MRIAIAMRTFEEPEHADAGECYAEFEVGTGGNRVDAPHPDADDVQVTVVLRGRREELEDPARNVTELVLRALESHRTRRQQSDVIDVAGVAVAASGPG
jgi:hypothetical protein